MAVPEFHEQPEPPLLFCEMPQVGSVATPNRVTPDIAFTRKFFNDRKTMPDGREIEYWTFEDGSGVRDFPAPVIRVRQGQIVHTTLRASKSHHTIHHHGIEPGPHDDGVGHTSFEVSGEYTYQWRPATAGTYFYHCHVNTVLHFEMGMYGGLIVDPPSGPGTLFPGLYPYDVEAFWACGGWDPAKHTLQHAAGLQGEDVGLNLWLPKYFHINGAFHPTSRTSPKSAIRARAGQTILLRLLNAGYSTARATFGGLTGTFVGSDGRQLDTPFQASEWLMGGAERYDILLKPSAPGTYTARIEHHHYVTHAVLGFAEANIVVT